MTQTTRYVPAAGLAIFNGLYDPLLSSTTREKRWRPVLSAAVLDGSPDAVLDLGCGTGTLAIGLAAAAPDARIVGVDGDPSILARAKAKTGSGRVEWVESLGQSLPFESGSFDRVVSSLVFHHLQPSVKLDVLKEARRVLRDGGSLHITDWGRPHDAFMRAAFYGIQLLDGFSNTADHAAGRLPDLIAEAGFDDVVVTDRLRTPFGTLETIRAA